MTRVRFREFHGVQSSYSERVQAQGLAAIAGDRQSLRGACLSDGQAAKGQSSGTQQSDWPNHGLRTGWPAKYCRWADGAR